MVCVIGGTGLVGSHLLCELVKNEDGIRASYRDTNKLKKVKKVFDFYFGSQSSEQWKKVNWEYVDINDVTVLDSFISEKDEVYHCAALVSFHRKDFSRLMKINREGTTNVVNVCLSKNIKKLCYISSTAAVNGGKEATVTESTKWKKSEDTSAYSISKYGAEREVWRGIEEGLSAVIVNPCVILGAGDWNESSLTILRQIKKGLSFYPPGGNAIVDARDVAACMHRLMKSTIVHERFLLIGENISFRNLFEKIAIQMGKKPPSRAVGLFGLTLARVIMSIWSLFTRTRSPMTKETVDSALSTTVYSNEKIKARLDYSFFTLDETIENAVKGKIA